MQEFLIGPINLIIFVGVVQGVVFTLITQFSELRNERTIVYLGLTVLFLSLNNLQYWLVATRMTAFLPYYKHLLIPWYLLIVPTFYQFFTYYLRVNENVPTFTQLTYTLFTTGILIRIGLLYYVHYIVETSIQPLLLVKYNLVEETLCLAYSLFIFSFAIYVLVNNKAWYQYIRGYDDLKWVKQFFTYGTVVLVLWVTAVLQQYLIGLFNPPESYYPVRLGTSFLIYWIGYRGLFRYKVLQEQIALRKELSEQQSELTSVNLPLSPTYTVAVVSEKQQEYLDGFYEIIVHKKRFLDSRVSLDSLAKELSISSSYLSQIVNKYYSKNLNSYLNSLRIEYAKELLVDPKYKHYTILAIGLESGFSSKSAFYTAFRKHTSMSPSRYREHCVQV